jgi:hypothetical protein
MARAALFLAALILKTFYRGYFLFLQELDSIGEILARRQA